MTTTTTTKGKGKGKGKGAPTTHRQRLAAIRLVANHFHEMSEAIGVTSWRTGTPAIFARTPAVAFTGGASPKDLPPSVRKDVATVAACMKRIARAAGKFNAKVGAERERAFTDTRKLRGRLRDMNDSFQTRIEFAMDADTLRQLFAEVPSLSDLTDLPKGKDDIVFESPMS